MQSTNGCLSMMAIIQSQENNFETNGHASRQDLSTIKIQR